ncbi:MAG: Ig-like domain-containing protein, partial [Pusillimonas sp.]
KLSGVTVAGDGTVIVTALQPDTDLSKITPATLNVTVIDSISLAGLDLSNVDNLTVAAAGVTASEAQLTALAGKVTLIGDGAALAQDTTPPTATIEITAIADDTGSSTTDFVTSDTTLTLSGTMTGTLAFGEKAQVSVDGTQWIDLTVTDGSWSYTDSRTLTSGQYIYSVRTIDAAGNTTVPVTQTVTVDAAVPTASGFIVTATTVGATSTEAGSLGLYDGAGKVIGSFSTSMTANTPATLDMTAQDSVTNATLKIADATSNFAADTRSVLLGTTGDDLLTGTDQIDYIYGFDGEDIISGEGGDDTLAGGRGADRINVGTGTDLVVLRNNDSGQNNSTGSSVSTVGFDIYTGLSAGDKVEIYRDVTWNSFGSVVTSSSDVAGFVNAIKFTRGTYTPDNNQFTAGASGNDTLVTYDLSTPTGERAPVYESIVLVGFVGQSDVGSTSSGRGATVTLIDFD